MIVTTAPVPAETTIRFNDELWTVEVARLLLEVDEGWVGYRHNTIWHWHEETYETFAAICCNRKWLCNSKASCMAMLQAIRTGVINIKFSNATHTLEGYAQWSLIEMRELGAQMRCVVDDESLTIRWPAQLEVFIQIMTSKDETYTINDRTAEDFAARAGIFIPQRTLLLIDSELAYRYDNATIRTVNQTRATRRTQEGEMGEWIRWATLTSEQNQRTGRVIQAQALDDVVDSANEPLQPRRNIHVNVAPGVKNRARNRNVDTLEDEDVLWQDNTLLEPEKTSGPATQKFPQGHGELLPIPVTGGGQLTASIQHFAGIGQSLLPDTTGPRRPPLAANQTQATQESTPMRESSRQTESAPTSSRQYTADQAQSVNGIRNSAAAPKQPTRKCRRVQQSSVNDHNGRKSSTKANVPSPFRNLNPYERPGKLWGEFVVEVLLAERFASNADELDYVQFVRGLYEI